MFEVRQTKCFSNWLMSLRDPQARARILKRLDRGTQRQSG